MLPSNAADTAGAWSYSLISVVVLWVVSRLSCTPRENGCRAGGPAPSSKMVTVPSGWSTASCWSQVEVPGPILKLGLFPPSDQRTAPVVRLIRYTADVLRIEIMRSPPGTSAIELAWYGSHGWPLAGGTDTYEALRGTWSRACHSNSTSPVWMSISWTTASITGCVTRGNRTGEAAKM